MKRILTEIEKDEVITRAAQLATDNGIEPEMADVSLFLESHCNLPSGSFNFCLCVCLKMLKLKEIKTESVKAVEASVPTVTLVLSPTYSHKRHCGWGDISEELLQVESGVATVMNKFGREEKYRLSDGSRVVEGEPWLWWDMWQLSEEDCRRLREQPASGPAGPGG